MLTFDEATHTYRWDGRVVPSVTQILAPVATDFSFVRADVLEAAADRGRAVHRAIHELEEDRLDLAAVPPDVLQFLSQYQQWRDQAGFVWERSEVMGYSERWGYAGTADLVGWIRGERWLIDVKASAAVPRSVGPQTAAYAELLPEKPLHRGVLHLRPDRHRLTPLSNRGDWGVFLSCLTVYKFNEGAK